MFLPCLTPVLFIIFSSPEPKSPSELIGWDSSQRQSVCSSLSPIFKHEYLRDQLANLDQISSGALLGCVLVAIGFGLDQIRTLVSMATYSSHRVIMGEIL